MVSSNLAERFSEDSYATRPEVARALGTNLIDSIWNQILDYRKGFQNQTGLVDVYKDPLVVNLCNSVVRRVGVISARFMKAYEDYSALKVGSIERNTVRGDMFKAILRYVAKAKGIIINDIAIENVILGRNTNLLYTPLVNYYNALVKFEQSSSYVVDETMIASYLELLNGGGELLSFYRTNEITVPSQKVLINREYEGIPTNQIEAMMSNLIDFINNPNLEVPSKLATINYVFNYVRPFESFNEEICVILMKCALATSGVGSVAALMPIEIVLSNDKDGLANAFKESQKSKDLTYYVLESSKLFDECITYMLDRIVQVTRDEAEKAFFSEKPGFYEETPVQSEPTPAPTYVTPEPVKPVEKPRKVEVAPKAEPHVDLSHYEQLDEKALKAAANELLESDPYLRPAQAHFFVRHSTKGKYYTIQQFKKAEGVVYETARTSMDNLAKRGYYRREQVKNKFVYTPISKE